MNGASDPARQGQLHSRRVLLRRLGEMALGAMITSVLAACGPAAATTPTSGPASAPAPNPTAAPAAAPTLAPAAAANPTTAPAAAAGGAPSGTLRYANADFCNESTGPDQPRIHLGLCHVRLAADVRRARRRRGQYRRQLYPERRTV